MLHRIADRSLLFPAEKLPLPIRKRSDGHRKGSDEARMLVSAEEDARIDCPDIA